MIALERADPIDYHTRSQRLGKAVFIARLEGVLIAKGGVQHRSIGRSMKLIGMDTPRAVGRADLDFLFA